jgi:hypothetical protein
MSKIVTDTHSSSVNGRKSMVMSAGSRVIVARSGQFSDAPDAQDVQRLTNNATIAGFVDVPDGTLWQRALIHVLRDDGRRVLRMGRCHLLIIIMARLLSVCSEVASRPPLAHTTMVLMGTAWNESTN